MKPLPVEIGQLQCTIERNSSGFNKFWPKYTLMLSSNSSPMLSSKKLAKSKTSHYRIEIANQSEKFKQG